MVMSPTFEPSTVSGGEASTGTASLNSPAPAGGATLSLSTVYPQTVTLPETVTIPEGATSTTFPVETTPVSDPLNATVLIHGEGTLGNALGVLYITP